MIEESTFLEVDCTSERNNLFLSDSTNNGVRTTDKSELEIDVTAAVDAKNDSSACDNDSSPVDMDLEDDPSDTHEDDDYEVSYMIPVHKNGTLNDLSLTPISIMVVDTIGLLPSRKLLKVLFDPGSTRTLIKASIVPKKAKAVTLTNKKEIKAIPGSMNDKYKHDTHERYQITRI